MELTGFMFKMGETKYFIFYFLFFINFVVLAPSVI